MKTKGLFFTTIAVIIALLISCASSGSTNSNDKKAGADFNMVQGKTWQLAKVEKADKIIELNTAENMFTISFNNNRVSGKALPNNYSGQVISQDKEKISFSQMASTRMALLTDPKNILLQEDEYFQLLQKTTSWGIKDNNLILYTVDNANKETKLVYLSK